MISLLTGTVAALAGNVATLDVNGVGYEVFCTRGCSNTLFPGEKARIVIHTEVKEDSIKLYGFEDELEKQVFLLLQKVKGVGAKSSADIVSKANKLNLLRIIGSGDLAGLLAIKGIGKKTAERIIVELRESVGDYVVERSTNSGLQVELEVTEPAYEAIEALQALGFAKKDAEKAVSQARSTKDFSGLNSGEIVKEALRFV